MTMRRQGDGTTRLSALVRAICSQAALWEPKRALDLYCGIGISSLLLARKGCRVVGVDANEEAVRLAAANAKKNNVAHTSFLKANVEDVLESLLKKEKPELVIINPPREGLSPGAVRMLTAAPPQKLIYISCMPPTLARDIKLLAQAGYQLQSVQGYDMFPQTAHVETVAVLTRIM